MTDYIVVSGSRSFVLHPDAKALYNVTEKFILSYREKYSNPSDPDSFWLIVGGAEGFDEACAKIAMRNDIPYLLALPNSKYGAHYWRDKPLFKHPNRYNTFLEICKGAAEVHTVVPNGLIYEHGVHSNHLRNKWMINEALAEENSGDTAVGLVCQINHSPGTWNFMKYANSRSLPYYQFNVTSREFEYVEHGAASPAD